MSTDTITTAAELDALPEYSVIRSHDGADPNAAICYDLPALRARVREAGR